MQTTLHLSLLFIIFSTLSLQSMRLTQKNEFLKTSREHWIQTNDNHTIIVNIKDQLPTSKLKYLLLTYLKKFKPNNTRDNPIKIGLSLAEINLLIDATCALKHDITQFNFTDQEHNTLLDMALAFKSLDLYVALLDPKVPKGNQKLLPLPELNQYIAQLLLQLDHTCQFQTPQEEFVQEIINQTIRLNDKEEDWNLPRNIQYTHDKKYYIIYHEQCSTVNIYEATTNIVVKEFKHSYKFTLFPTKNLILIFPCFSANYYDACLFLYEVNNDKLHTLMSNISGRCNFASTGISPNENYIAACHDSNVLLWDINDLHNIIEYKQPHNTAGGVAFSPDNTMLISTVCLQEALTNTDELRLWEINTTGITCVANVKNLKNINPYFGNTNETFIVENATTYTTQKFCIHQNNNNYSITPSTGLHKGKILRKRKHFNEFFYNDDVQTNKSIIYSLSQGIIDTYPYKDNNRIKCSHNNKHIAVAPMHHPREIHIAHLSNNATYLGTNTQQLPEVKSSYAIDLQFNKDDSLILLRTPNHMILCDTYGNCIREWFSEWRTRCSQEPKFHPFGNALMTKEQLFPLYDLNTRPIANTIAQQLTISQYVLLKKAVDKKRSAGQYIKIKKNSLDYHSLKTLQKNEQALMTEQLYLKTEL